MHLEKVRGSVCHGVCVLCEWCVRRGDVCVMCVVLCVCVWCVHVCYVLVCGMCVCVWYVCVVWCAVGGGLSVCVIYVWCGMYVCGVVCVVWYVCGVVYVCDMSILYMSVVCVFIHFPVCTLFVNKNQTHERV